ncbi:MAG TPA: alpha/beta hydrolase [Ktedonobacterales bacterium]
MKTGDTNKQQILFIQGGGNGGYEADAKLATSLQAVLGAAYEVRYPRMRTDEALPDFGWGQQIDEEMAAVEGEVILVGHSLGASVLLKLLSESDGNRHIAGIFLIATPFWGGDKNWQYEGLTLQADFGDKLPKGIPLFLYQCRDDEEVPVAHLALYAQALRQATIRELAGGGHQLGNDLTPVAEDIKSLR